MQKELASKGFTLVELVAVILILGIVSTVVLPRFSSRDAFSGYALRDEIISSYRLIQQRAMYDNEPGVCYRLVIDSNGIRPQKNSANYGNLGHVTLDGDYAGLSVTVQTIYFDGLGNAYTDDCTPGSTSVATPLTLTVLPQGLEIEIYPTGYIKAS